MTTNEGGTELVVVVGTVVVVVVVEVVDVVDVVVVVDVVDGPIEVDEVDELDDVVDTSVVVEEDDGADAGVTGTVVTTAVVDVVGGFATDEAK